MPEIAAPGSPADLQALHARVLMLEMRLATAQAGQTMLDSIDSMLEGLQIIGPDWRYLYINETAARHGRRPRAELLNRTMMECYPGIENTPLFAALTTTMQARRRTSMENEFVYEDGARAWFEIVANPVPQGLLVLSLDITDRKRAEEEVRSSRENLAAILASMTDAVITLDGEGNTLALNPAAERLTGWADHEAKGRAFAELATLCDSSSGHRVANLTRILSDERAGLHRHVLVNRFGHSVPVSSRGAPLLDLTGTRRGAVLVLRDMSAESQLLAQLQQAQKMEAIGRLAGGIAHDFSNILTVINTFASFLLDGPTSAEDVRECASTVLDAGGRAARLTAQLLAFSRKQIFELQPVDLNKVVSDTDQILRRLIGEDVMLECVLDPSVGAILGDVSQLEQILMNLVVNARDAMPDGGRLTIETRAVELTEASAAARGTMIPPGTYVMVAVSDTGVGMDAQTQARAFEPFFTTKGIGKGTGLGLSTVYGIVTQLQGYIWLYSEPGQGTTFKIHFPRYQGDAIAAPAPRPAALTRPATETILLVEDDEQIRAATARILTKGGYRLLVAPNGRQGLELCQSHPGRIDLLVTDVIMPGMNGRELAEQACALVPGLRVLYASGYTDDVIVRHGILESGTNYLAKPFTPDGLLRKVRETLETGAEVTAAAG